MIKDDDAKRNIHKERGGPGFSGYPTFPGGYPKNFVDDSYPGRWNYPPQPVDISDHFRSDNHLPLHDPGFCDCDTNMYKQVSNNHTNYVSENKAKDDAQHLISDKADHFIRDYNDPSGITFHNKLNLEDEYYRFFDKDAKTRATTVTRETSGTNDRPVFSGSTTLVNPFGDINKANIINFGLEYMEIQHATMYGIESNNSGSIPTKFPPLSPLHPFTRINDLHHTDVVHTAKQGVFRTYNRTHLPIADVEFRKGFRHMFFNRPECYVVCMEQGNIRLCEQTMYDEDFSSLYSRLPHVVQLLAPAYVTGSFSPRSSSNREPFTDNWNYLLSNRFLNMTVSEETLSQKETVTKSAEGYTITPGLHLESRTGSTLSISFRDTKDLEVYEFIKAWMAYIHKRARGIFYPPFNGYAYHNDFLSFSEVKQISSRVDMERGLHPYDRALEYTASVFDIVTNESDSKIIYWCKYYGLYPISVSTQLNSENNRAIAPESMITEVQFRYQYKLPGVNKSLVEFNYNSGLCDCVGMLKGNTRSPEYSSPFMVREKTSGIANGKDKYERDVLAEYIGASGMFTGTPFIVMARTGMNPLRELNGAKEPIVSPVLRFMNLDDQNLNNLLNLNITEEVKDRGLSEIAHVK